MQQGTKKPSKWRPFCFCHPTSSLTFTGQLRDVNDCRRDISVIVWRYCHTCDQDDFSVSISHTQKRLSIIRMYMIHHSIYFFDFWRFNFVSSSSSQWNIVILMLKNVKVCKTCKRYIYVLSSYIYIYIFHSEPYLILFQIVVAWKANTYSRVFIRVGHGLVIELTFIEFPN